ncbi:MAG: hypothetical protein LV481_01320 [Methylacidiphilales bacterium]|nr:hypothetical protein [Candidatus Methylacidiphilales bacterium]
MNSRRHEIKSLLRSMVDKITVEFGKAQYTVEFRGGSQPITVFIKHSGPMFSPSPCPDGKMTNVVIFD